MKDCFVYPWPLPPPCLSSTAFRFRLTVEEGLAALRGAQRGAMRARSPDYKWAQEADPRRPAHPPSHGTAAVAVSGDNAVALTKVYAGPVPRSAKAAPKPSLNLKRPNNRYKNAAGISAAAALRSAPPVWGELKVTVPAKSVEAVPAKTSKLLTSMQQRAAQRDQLKQVGFRLYEHFGYL